MVNFDVKPCAIAASAAFVLSILLGLLNAVGPLALVLRALLLGVGTFGFVAGVQILVARFLPDLLGSEGGEAGGSEDDLGPRLGERIDLSVGEEVEGGGYAGQPSDPRSEETLGAVEAVSSGEEIPAAESANSSPGLDQEKEGGYTVARGTPGSKSNVVAARPPDLIGDVDVLPDLESLSDSFITPVTVDSDVDGGSDSRAASYRGGTGSSGTSLGGSEEFDAKEMAMAIQTILKRDEKG